MGFRAPSARTARCCSAPTTATTTSRSTSWLGPTIARVAIQKRCSDFWNLVEWSDEERKRTGKGSELRDEAIQYLAIGFAYDDWNENQITDPLEGLPRGIERVQDPKLLPQDRPFTSEVFFRLGYVYFDEAKYPEAIEIWRLSLKRWPMDPQAPEVQNSIALAYSRHNEQAEAIAARAKLSDYGEGSDWWEANKDHPVEQRRAEELAEDALVNTAIAHHQRAQELRRRCVELQEPDLCTQAQEQYSLAALAYRGYIQRYPNSPHAYELNYNLADTLYWSENYEDAAKEYASVRDSNLDDTYLSISARLAVESIKRLVEKKSAGGELQVRTEPPVPAGTPPKVTPIEPPELVQRLARARETYLARVDDAHDAEKVRDSYFYNNTLLLYLYGYWDSARQRFLAEFYGHCSGPTADETGQVAWLNLRNMAVALNETEEVRRLGAELQSHKCTFSPTGSAVASAVDCSKPENKDAPLCVAGQDLTNLRYRDAVAIFARAEKSSGDEQRALYEQAASELVKAVNDEPNHPQAPLALEKRCHRARAHEPIRVGRTALPAHHRRGRSAQSRNTRGPASARRDPGQRVLPPRLQRQPLLRLRSRGRKLPHARRLRSLRQVQEHRDGRVAGGRADQRSEDPRVPTAVRARGRILRTRSRYTARPQRAARRALSSRGDAVQAWAVEQDRYRDAFVHRALPGQQGCR